MQGAVKHPGALHRELGVPADKKIPAKKLEAATHSDNPTERRRAVLAETFRHAHHPGTGPAHHNGGERAHHQNRGA
jgi:hypothetical protein